MFVFRHVTLPVVSCLLLAVSFPYVTAAGVVPIFGKYVVGLFFYVWFNLTSVFQPCGLLKSYDDSFYRFTVKFQI